ncbi:MAG TPA: hypothetical protein PKH39_17805 [Woeseiaceae bacterium]|nr:hypothetical protein [Woeseiaceae bacterium]
MKTNEPPRVSLYFILLIAFALVVAAIDSRADDCRGRSCNDGVDIDITGGDVKNVLTGGDVSNVLTGGDNTASSSALVGGSRNYSVGAPGLSDVDIAGCLGSTSWSFLIAAKQKLVLNQVCMAEFYLNNGLYELAAMSLCNVPEILMEFDSEANCEAAHNFKPTFHVQQPTSSEPKEDDDEHADDIVQLYVRLNQLEAQREKDAEALRKAQSQRPVTREVVQQRYLTDKQRAALQEVLKK